MATVGFLGRGAFSLSSSTVGIVDGILVTDLEVLLADEGWHCLLVVLETGRGVVGLAGAYVVESRLFKSLSVTERAYWGNSRRAKRGITVLQVFSL